LTDIKIDQKPIFKTNTAHVSNFNISVNNINNLNTTNNITSPKKSNQSNSNISHSSSNVSIPANLNNLKISSSSLSSIKFAVKKDSNQEEFQISKKLDHLKDDEDTDSINSFQSEDDEKDFYPNKTKQF
jgi:histidyl-tRNA synthetase